MFLLFMAFVIQILWATQGPVDLYDGGVVDTDSYMRLNRVLHLVESGDWFDSTYPRSNAPYGEVQHWTRAMDTMLILGGSLGSLVLPFPTALHWWSVMISPLFQLAALLGLMWLVRPVFSRDRRLILGGTFILQPGVISYYLAGRVDHHGILLCCLILLLGFAFHMSISRLNWKTCVAVGIVSAVGVWLSIEFLIGVLVSFAFLACCWVAYGNDWAQRLMIVSGSLWGMATVALVIERGLGQWSAPEFDRFSVVHWTVFGLLAIVWMVMWLLKDYKDICATPRRRLIAGVLGGILLVGITGWLYPKIFHGPLVDVDPRIMTLLWDRVTETQPLISTDPWQFGRLLFMLGIALPGIPYLGWLIWKEEEARARLFWIMVGIASLVYLPLAVREMRWIAYTEFLFALPYAHFLHKLVLTVEPKLRCPWQGVIKATIVMVGAFGFVIGGSTLMAQESSAVGGTTAAHCPVKKLSEFLNEQDDWGDQERTIMAFVDFGPELLYRTRYRVIATPYHRNAAGVIDTYDVMSDVTEQRAKTILTTRQVNLVLLCPSSPAEPGFYMRKENAKDSFYGRLLKDKEPDWMVPVVLPPALADHFKLFEVKDSSPGHV
ncbi:MAG: hypothetical protein MRJ96_10015 [Nitrospirales bacterium]|nr:hypothetical protein [Nitrospira sp.]MDR4501772.1 hypothetical protein [Nitrospirales bacterium]